MPSILDTLKETVILWGRNLWYLMVLALIDAPEFVFQFNHNFHVSQTIWWQVLDFILQTGFLVFSLINMSAIFGLLNRGPAETVSAAAWHGVKTDTWAFFKALLITVLVIMPCALLTGLNLGISNAFALTKIPDSIMEIILRSILYSALFVSFLAYPSIAVEKLKAKDALKQSLRMTRRFFPYVVGCYLILFLGEWFVRWATNTPLDRASHEMTWASIPMEVVLEITSSAWIVLVWCMYRRLKAAEIQALPDAIPN